MYSVNRLVVPRIIIIPVQCDTEERDREREYRVVIMNNGTLRNFYCAVIDIVPVMVAQTTYLCVINFNDKRLETDHLFVRQKNFVLNAH